MTTLIVLPARVVSGSGRGSDRGSGYWQSNPILRHCDKLFATWQVYEPSTSEFRVFVGTNQLGISGFSQTSALPDPATVSGWTGQAMDNHGVASIIADKAGFLHLLYGAHRAPMLEAVSLNPWDANGFNSVIVPTAPWIRTTYSSLVRDSVGNLHVVYRGDNSAGNERLIYQRGTTNTTNGATLWGPPQVLASTSTMTGTVEIEKTGYSNYAASIAVDAKDRLHVAYMMYYHPTGAAPSWGYLRSNDVGTTWENWNGIPGPVYSNSTNMFVESSPSLDVRLCNIAIDPAGDPWISIIYLAPSYGLGGYDTKLWRLKNGQWSAISLTPHLLAWYGPTARAAGATITFDAKGGLYVAADMVDMNDSTKHAWFAGNSKEVILLFSADYGQTFQVYPISVPNPSGPRWLANIERPTTGAPIQVPSLLYTDCPLTNVSTGDTAKPTDIVFVPLYKN